MAIGWLALLRAVPWAEVAKKAPEIAEGAKKLWGNVARKTPQTESEVHTVYSSEEIDVKWLKDKIGVVEAANIELQKQMLTTSELIKALADQNTQLIKNIEINRVRIKWLAALIVAVGVVAVYCLLQLYSYK